MFNRIRIRRNFDFLTVTPAVTVLGAALFLVVVVVVLVGRMIFMPLSKLPTVDAHVHECEYYYCYKWLCPMPLVKLYRPANSYMYLCTNARIM